MLIMSFLFSSSTPLSITCNPYLTNLLLPFLSVYCFSSHPLSSFPSNFLFHLLLFCIPFIFLLYFLFSNFPHLSCISCSSFFPSSFVANILLFILPLLVLFCFSLHPSLLSIYYTHFPLHLVQSLAVPFFLHFLFFFFIPLVQFIHCYFFPSFTLLLLCHVVPLYENVLLFFCICFSLASPLVCFPSLLIFFCIYSHFTSPPSTCSFSLASYTFFFPVYFSVAFSP